MTTSCAKGDFDQMISVTWRCLQGKNSLMADYNCPTTDILLRGQDSPAQNAQNRQSKVDPNEMRCSQGQIHPGKKWTGILPGHQMTFRQHLYKLDLVYVITAIETAWLEVREREFSSFSFHKFIKSLLIIASTEMLIKVYLRLNCISIMT